MPKSNKPHMTIVILGDGDFPTAEYPLQILNSADIIICCDNSVVKLLKYNSSINFDYIVGDIDTLSLEYQKKYEKKIHKSTCQETNDQTKAFSFALGLISQDVNAHIHVLGSTGRREDHTLGNISLLLDYAVAGSIIPPYGNKMRDGITVDIITNHGVFTPHFNSFTSDCEPKQQISIFAFDQTLNIKSKGLLYPLDNVVFDLWWKATLNECVAEQYSLTFSHPAKVLVFSNYTNL